MSPREPNAATTFYAEGGIRRQSGLPRLLRTRIIDGVPHDSVWRVDSDEWVDTSTLFQYRLNMEENEIRPITARLAAEIQEREREWWREVQASR